MMRLYIVVAIFLHIVLVSNGIVQIAIMKDRFPEPVETKIDMEDDAYISE